GKAVAHPKRLEILDLLCQGPRSVEVLAGEAGLGIASASQHLKVLKEARLLEAEKNGLFVTYRLADEAVCAFYRSMRSLAESRLAEVEQITRRFLDGREGMEPVEADELLQRLREGRVTVLDVRPTEEYRAGHIAGALSIPMKELKARIKDVPRGHRIVAYCRGPYCVLAVQAVETLRQAGLKAVRLREGYPEWRAAGMPVDATGGPEMSRGKRRVLR
ncbi:MAG: ArsR family transcriptional regulator, partial [Acidobacteria bacterium]